MNFFSRSISSIFTWTIFLILGKNLELIKNYSSLSLQTVVEKINLFWFVLVDIILKGGEKEVLS